MVIKVLNQILPILGINGYSQEDILVARQHKGQWDKVVYALRDLSVHVDEVGRYPAKDH